MIGYNGNDRMYRTLPLEDCREASTCYATDCGVIGELAWELHYRCLENYEDLASELESLANAYHAEADSVDQMWQDYVAGSIGDDDDSLDLIEKLMSLRAENSIMFVEDETKLIETLRGIASNEDTAALISADTV